MGKISFFLAPALTVFLLFGILYDFDIYTLVNPTEIPDLTPVASPICPEPYLHVSRNDSSVDAVLLFEWTRGFLQKQPEHSLCLTLHNREDTVKSHLLSITYNVGKEETYELIIVLDNCLDNTEKVLMNILLHDNWDKQSGSNLVRVVLIKTPVSLFETRSNNLAMKSSCGKFITLIQDDMFITETDFNIKLVQPLRQFSDLIAVSGRCAHWIYSSSYSTYGVGRCDIEINKPLNFNAKDKCTLFVRDTVNRGPLSLRVGMLRQLNYLDEEHHVLENDDHDLMVRAYLLYGWKSGLRAISFDAPLASGGSRRPGRTEEEKLFLADRKHLIQGSFLAKLLETNNLPLPHDENRPISDCV